MRCFERIIVEQFLITTIVAVILLVAGVGSILLFTRATLAEVSTATDTLLKALAILVGAMWSLNRYFTTRTDYPQLRVEMTLDSLPSIFGDADNGLLSCRLNIVNTSKVLLPIVGYRVEISNVLVHQNEVLYERLNEWPGTGAMHSAAPIEPNSWAAISIAFACPKDVRAVRTFLEVQLENGASWTWHRILTIGPTPVPVGNPALDVEAPGTS
jgi:hypothetical protein